MLPKTLASHTIHWLCQQYQLGKYLNGSLTAIRQGLAHQCWRIATEQGSFLVKQRHHLDVPPLPGQSKLAVSRQMAQQIQCAISQHQLPLTTPHGCVITHHQTEQFSVSPWIKGKHSDRSHTQLSTIAQMLASFHSTSPQQALSLAPIRLHASSWLQTWQQATKPYSAFVQLNELAEFIANRIIPFCQHHHTTTCTAILSHQDLRPDNVIWQANKPVILDWEFTGWVAADVDLLNMLLDWSIDSHNHAPNPQAWQRLLDTYQASGLTTTINANSWGQVFARWIKWMLWCLAILEKHPSQHTQIHEQVNHTLTCLSHTAVFAQKKTHINIV